MNVINRIRTKLALNAMDKLSDDNEELTNKLIADAKKKNKSLKIERIEGLPGAFYTLDDDKARQVKKKLFKKGVKSGLSKRQAAINANKAMKDSGIKSIYRRNSILLSEYSNNPAMVAHEIGHSTMNNSKFGRAYKRTYMTLSKPGAITSGSAALSNDKRLVKQYRIGHGLIAANAVHSGFMAGRAKAKGKKVGWLTKNKAWIAPAAISAPTLFEEGRASIIGYNKLKKLGASKTDLKRARSGLGAAYATYLVDPALRMANAGLSYYAAKKLAEKYYKNKTKNKKKNDYI